jgi:hypothetical protein
MAQTATKIKPADLVAGDGFGSSIALDGDYALIGAPGVSGDAGAAYLYHYDGTTWVEQARLTEEPEALNFHNFGYSVALRGEYAFVGKQIEEPFASGPGAVYVYKRSGEQWTLHQTLRPHDSTDPDGFGIRLAVSGNWLLVGGGLSRPYMFEQVGEEWIERQSLEPLAGRPFSYGISIALEGDYAFVSASASEVSLNTIYVFKQVGGVWSEVAQVVPEDGAVGNRFGIDVALDGETLVAAADKDDDAGTDAGAIYVFVREGETWTQQAKLYTGDSQPPGGSTWEVGIRGDTLLLGVHRHLDTGVVYRYTRTGTEWKLLDKLQPETEFTHFGSELALDDRFMMIGAAADPDGGAVYVYPVVPEIEVSAPNGGETLALGQTSTITWTSTNIPATDSVQIRLLQDGVSLRILQRKTPNDGSHAWTVPSDLLPGANYQVRLTWTGNTAIKDNSDGFFTIEAGSDPYIGVLSPTRGEVLTLGQVYPITWQDNVSGLVTLRLTRAGVYLRNIRANTPSDGHYDWVVPVDLEPGNDYQVRITSVEDPALKDNSCGYFTLAGATAMDQQAAALPREVETWAYPNPFNPVAVLRYGLPVSSVVRLEVYDVLGRVVARLVEGVQAAGWHAVVFDGSSLPSGVYLYRLEAGTFTQARTMLLVK